jgi:autotransporter-associated beta strand protein
MYLRFKSACKNTKLVPALCAIFLLFASSSVAQNFTAGDLLIGFRDLEAAADINYVINLGQATRFESLNSVTIFGTNGVESNDYGDDLRSIYGNSWFTNSNLNWSIYAQTGARTTQYVGTSTGSTGDPGTAPIRRNPNSLGTPNSVYSTVGGIYFNSSLNQPYNGDPVATGTAVLTGGEWSTAMSTLDDFTTEAAIFSDSPVLSLYKAVPTTQREQPALHLGYFSINNLGLITYTPGSFSGGGGSYTGPWNWTAGSGNWSVTNNWTSNQVASNGFAVGITGASGGTITNNAVTNLSSLTYSNTAGSFTLTGTNAGQTLTISGGITNNSSATQTINLSIAGEGGVTQSGTGTTVLSQSNSYTGGTILSSGAVVIGNNNALGSGTVTLSGASSLIARTANLSTTNAMALNAATTLDTAANRWTNAGTLSGSGSLTKIGSGTLTLSGTSTGYSGASAINAGALQVTGNLGTGTVTVNNGASLSGTGTVGGVLVQSNGILTGGVDGAVGKLTVSGGMTFSAGSILNWKLSDASSTNAGSAFDSFAVGGTLNLNGLGIGSTLQFNILNAVGGTTGFLNNQNSQWLVASANSITGFSTNDITISTAGFTNALGGGSFSFSTNGSSGLGLYLVFTALGVDPWTGNIAAGSSVISGQTITSTNNAVIGANSSRNGSVAVTNNGVWNVQGTLQVGGSTNGSGTLTIGSGGRITANGLTISDQRGSRGLVLITNGASQNAISLGAGTVSFGSGNGTLQFAHTNAVTISNAISGRGTISSTGTGITTLSGNQSGFTGTNSLSSGKVVLASGVTNGGIVNIAGRGTNVVFAMNTNSVLSTTGTHAVAGLLLDNSGKAFKDSIKGSVALSPTGVLQKTYATNESVAGFGAGIGSGKSFSILAGTAASNGTNTPTLQAKIVNGQLDFHGTTTNAIVMSMKDPSYSNIRNQIQWYNTNVPVGQKGYWTNTTAGNGMNGTTANVSFGAIENMLVGTNKTLWNETKGGFTGSFNTFLLGVNGSAGFGTIANLNDPNNLLEDINALSGDMIESYLNKIMGAFGYDNATKTSWAVINHNSIFGDGSATFSNGDLLNDPIIPDLSVFSPPSESVTTQAVPEPGTWALMALGAGVLLLAAKRRKDQSK